MLIDKGSNDRWPRLCQLRRAGRGPWTVTLKEPLGQAWTREIVSFALPSALRARAVVASKGAAVPCQVAEGRLFVLVENLAPGEERTFLVTPSAAAPTAAPDVTVAHAPDGLVLSNGVIGLRLPAALAGPVTGELPGPVVAVRRGQGSWLGHGRLECRLPLQSLTTTVAESGPLWTGVAVTYRFADDHGYRVLVRLRPGDEVAEVREASTLPVRLWPAWRPYREIGSLGASFWAQSREDIAKPCLRPCPTSNFIFDLRHGFAPGRLVTHSTSSWEIMDLPLDLPQLKTYTAMRPAIPFVDGGWLAVYDPAGDDLLGVASLDVAHWASPDESIHPAHRTPGASAEVLLVTGPEVGAHLRFPVEGVQRRWLLGVFSRRQGEHLGVGAAADAAPVRLAADPELPLWRLRRTRGDLALDKVKDWQTEWPERGDEHPRLYCRPADFPALRAKIEAVPELRAHWLRTRADHGADRHLMGQDGGGLASIEAATHAGELIATILARGYAGPIYAIGLARPLRRYLVACDVQWASFTPAERQTARRVIALGAYIMTDGDWWQYTFRPGETTYLPNFNSDVFCCAGLAGMFLSDHPCAKVWTQHLVGRMDLELRHHLRNDGGGEENVGCYLLATWTMLYLPALWALRHCGVKDYSRHPAIHGGARYLLKALGPCDPRDGGRRMMPPIGHHPYARKALTFGAWLAAFIKDADPQLAAHLMWAWRATGALVHRNTDHSGPAAEPFTRHYVFHDPTIPELAPTLGSENLPNVGAVLRTHDAGGHGSYLFLKAGRVHSHHDEDEGSFHYFGRGVPLALDGLPLMNGATAAQHNAVTFARTGQPSGMVECLTVTPGADYLRAAMRPRAFCCDPNYVDDTHRSGFVRELVLVKAPQPGAVEYLVVKDTTMGPEACQWNLDVLSIRPVLRAPGHVWFPGHRGPGFDAGLEVFFLEPEAPAIAFEAGKVNEKLLTPEGRTALTEIDLDWTVTEHWLMHVPAPAGTTFVAVLFPRRNDEASPEVAYLAREETVVVRYAGQQDLIFLRPSPAVACGLDGVVFQGRAGVARSVAGQPYALYPLDAVRMESVEAANRRVRNL